MCICLPGTRWWTRLFFFISFILKLFFFFLSILRRGGPLCLGQPAQRQGDGRPAGAVLSPCGPTRREGTGFPLSSWALALSQHPALGASLKTEAAAGVAQGGLALSLRRPCQPRRPRGLSERREGGKRLRAAASCRTNIARHSCFPRRGLAPRQGGGSDKKKKTTTASHRIAFCIALHACAPSVHTCPPTTYIHAFRDQRGPVLPLPRVRAGYAVELSNPSQRLFEMRHALFWNSSLQVGASNVVAPPQTGDTNLLLCCPLSPANRGRSRHRGRWARRPPSMTEKGPPPSPFPHLPLLWRHVLLVPRVSFVWTLRDFLHAMDRIRHHGA